MLCISFKWGDDMRLDGFLRTVQRWADQTAIDTVRAVGGTVLLMQRAIVDGTSGTDGTPIDTGQAKSNWFVGVNQTITTVSNDTTKRNMGMAQNAIAQALAQPYNIKYVTLANNLPYIRHLEYGLYPNPPKNPTGKTVNGFSSQAPQGMFRINVKNFDMILKQLMRANRNG